MVSARNSSADALSKTRSGLFESASQLHGRQPGVPIRCHQRRQMRRLFVILVNFFLFAASVLPHLGSNEEMLRRLFDHVKGIGHLIDILRPLLSVFFGTRNIFPYLHVLGPTHVDRKARR
jgi:hypothetical protein